MKIWIDAQLTPHLAIWLIQTFQVEAQAVRDVGLRQAENEEIFQAARQAGAVVMSKDSDFPVLLARLGPPPQVIWITCGNTSNANLRIVPLREMPEAMRLLAAGEPVVEITG